MPLIFQEIPLSTEYMLYRKKDRRKCCRWACHEFREGQNHYFSAAHPIREWLHYKTCL